MDAHKPKPNITLPYQPGKSQKLNHHDGAGVKRTITLSDDLLALFERECKRPDSVLLQIIIGALHYLPNPRGHAARIRRQHNIQQGREANFNNAEMDEKTV
jgi:hypothetical protein